MDNFQLNPPNEEDCCGSGCNPCILDAYEAQLKNIKKLQNSTQQTLNNCISTIAYSVFELYSIEKISNCAFLYYFKYIRPQRGEILKNCCLSYKPGQHFLLRASNNGEQFTRAYTPIWKSSTSFSILVKLYENGKMSEYFTQLKLGKECLFRGPYGDINLNWNVKHLLFIAQGTAIAPIYAILKEALNNEDVEIFFKLFYCCSDYENIFLRQNIYEMSSIWNFTYEIFLSRGNVLEVKYNEVVHIKKLDTTDINNYLQSKDLTSLSIVICGSEIFTNTWKCRIEKDCNIISNNIICL